MHAKPAGEGVYVGEVVVTGIVKGTAFDAGGRGTVAADDVAAKFWELYSHRAPASVRVP